MNLYNLTAYTDMERGRIVMALYMGSKDGKTARIKGTFLETDVPDGQVMAAIRAIVRDICQAEMRGEVRQEVTQ